MDSQITICPVCGKSFYKKMARQKYCSPACERYANRHNKVTHEEIPGSEVIRTFTCQRCGKLVKVTDPLDKRLKFCSQHCEKSFWKHPEKAEALVVERTFVCRGCKKVVKVTDAFDRRHIFCSKKCQQKYAAKMSRKMRKKKAKSEDGAVRRSFICRQCGDLVEVTKKTDHRLIYCCAICREFAANRLAKIKRLAKERKE